ncbi:MAG: glycosyltransferase family 4 protein [Pseudorhodoplanes sp.]|uniref:glycosyltransferase family 4 protein n=1 Tax=Pseudorhodoplanes sp. TaxID=1934341 RepID=UPI003D0BC5EE
MRARLGRIIDISRLLTRLNRSSPTGIDRVEFAYVQHYANKYKSGIVRFFITTPLISGRISPFFARHVARVSLERWSLEDEVRSNRNFAHLMKALALPVGEAPVPIPKKIIEPRAGIMDWGTGALVVNAYYEAALSSIFQRRRQIEIQRKSWYLHISHLNLHEARRLAWIRRDGGQALFMIHDLLPISHPEFYSAEEAGRHRRRIETIARLGSLVIFNSSATKAAWDDYLRDKRLPNPPGEIVPLGVDPVFSETAAPDHAPNAAPYFLAMGTIAARKNLTFLLHTWREWVRRSEKPRARLVIVGRRAAPGESALDLLDRCPVLASTVIEISEMADRRVAHLLKGSRALLAPSLVEGFGLPVVEALAAGVPVIASNIQAHREAGGRAAEYLDPLDGRAWMQAFEDFSDRSSPRRQAALVRIAAQKLRSWDDHIGTVENLLRDREATIGE